MSDTIRDVSVLSYGNLVTVYGFISDPKSLPETPKSTNSTIDFTPLRGIQTPYQVLLLPTKTNLLVVLVFEGPSSLSPTNFGDPTPTYVCSLLYVSVQPSMVGKQTFTSEITISSYHPGRLVL